MNLSELELQNLRHLIGGYDTTHCKMQEYAECAQDAKVKQFFEKGAKDVYKRQAKAIGLVIPELNGKLIGSAQRVPTPTGSTTILTAVVKGNPTKEAINDAMKAASNESFGYNTDEIVSSDIVGMRYGSLFDATQTMVLPINDELSEVQVVSWYDNENSYTSQMVRTIKHFGKLLNA